VIGEFAQIKNWGEATTAIREVWKADSVRGRFTRGAVWSLMGAVISQGATLAASVITVRLLGREQFGEYGMVQSTIGMLGTFAGLGLGLTATKYVAELRRQAPTRAEGIMSLTMCISAIAGLVMAAVLAIGASSLAISINAPHLRPAFEIATLLLVFGTVNGVQNGILAGLEAFGTIALISTVRGIVLFPLALVGAMHWRVEGAIAALVCSAATATLAGQVLVRRACKRNGLRLVWFSGWGEFSVLASFALPALLSNSASSPITWMANTILVNHSNGYSELGLLNAANQLRTLAMFLPTTILQVALPILSSKTTSTKHEESFGNIMQKTHDVTVAIVFPIAIAIVFLSDVIIRLYGESFASGGAVVAAVGLTIAIMATGAATGPALQARGRMWLTFGINLSWGAVMLAFTWLMAESTGALAVAYGSALGYFVTTV